MENNEETVTVKEVVSKGIKIQRIIGSIMMIGLIILLLVVSIQILPEYYEQYGVLAIFFPLITIFAFVIFPILKMRLFSKFLNWIKETIIKRS